MYKRRFIGKWLAYLNFFIFCWVVNMNDLHQNVFDDLYFVSVI